jgi:hypothetical protein
VALVEAPADSPAVGRIWQRLGQGATAVELLAALVADGLGGTPGFALLAAAADGQPRLFCRGTVGATVVCDTAPVGAVPAGPVPGDGVATALRIDGAGLLTWREHVVPVQAERIFLGDPPADAELRLPAAAGVLLAGCVIIDLTNIAARDTLPYLAAVAGGATGADTAGPGGAGPGAVLADTVADPRGARPGGKQKTIVFFPDTITITHPGRAAGRAPAAPAPDRYQEVPSSARPWPPAGPVRPGGAPPTAPFTGANPPSGPIPSGPISSGPIPAGPIPAGTVPPAPGTMARPAWPGAGQAPGPAQPGGLIDVPPWLAGPGGQVAEAGRPQQETGPDEPGSTVKRPVLSDIVARTTPPDRIGPVVPALICPSGHVNPPSGGACRRCGAPLPHDAVLVPRPVLGVLRLSLGDVIALDRGVVMGRSPRTDFGGLDGEERPHVVKLPSADGDISRTHLRITLDGWHVLVTDLNSTNGTLLTLPGHEPQQLRPGEPVPMQPGTVVTLAEGIDFRYEVAE